MHTKSRKVIELIKYDLKRETLTSLTWKEANNRLWPLSQWTQ